MAQLGVGRCKLMPCLLALPRQLNFKKSGDFFKTVKKDNYIPIGHKKGDCPGLVIISNCQLLHKLIIILEKRKKKQDGFSMQRYSLPPRAQQYSSSTSCLKLFAFLLLISEFMPVKLFEQFKLTVFAFDSRASVTQLAS